MSEWTKLKDELPESGQQCVFCWRATFQWEYQIGDAVDGSIWSATGWLLDEIATHWMQIPEPPTNEEENQ